jgi:hypothetical protein
MNAPHFAITAKAGIQWRYPRVRIHQAPFALSEAQRSRSVGHHAHASTSIALLFTLSTNGILACAFAQISTLNA